MALNQYLSCQRMAKWGVLSVDISKSKGISVRSPWFLFFLRPKIWHCTMQHMSSRVSFYPRTGLSRQKRTGNLVQNFRDNVNAILARFGKKWSLHGSMKTRFSHVLKKMNNAHIEMNALLTHFGFGENVYFDFKPHTGTPMPSTFVSINKFAMLL